MNFKDMNVYQRAYKVALDLHRFLDGAPKIGTHYRHQLEDLSREILGNIAEGCSPRSRKARRFFNFRAIDALRRLQLDLDFFRDVQLMPENEYRLFYNECEICIKQLFKLNQSLQEKTEETEEAAKKEAVPVMA